MSKNRVLVIDDEKGIRDFLSMGLEYHNFEVYTAENGKAALSLCKELKPNLVILDINLPDIMGLEIAESIHNSKNNEFGKPKIIVMTGIVNSFEDDGSSKWKKAEDVARERWKLEYGVDDFLTKPFDLKQILHTVNKVLGII